MQKLHHQCSARYNTRNSNDSSIVILNRRTIEWLPILRRSDTAIHIVIVAVDILLGAIDHLARGGFEDMRYCP